MLPQIPAAQPVLVGRYGTTYRPRRTIHQCTDVLATYGPHDAGAQVVQAHAKGVDLHHRPARRLVVQDLLLGWAFARRAPR